MPKQDEMQAIASAVGGILTVDLEHGKSSTFTAAEMADRVSEPVADVEAILDRMAAGDELPVEKDGSRYVVG